MFKWLALAIIVVPALEIWVLLKIGSRIGGWATLGLMVLTGVLGAWLAKREARKVWMYARFQLARGELPTQSILDGICLFAGGLMLLTPGVLTDAAGFLLVLPPSRAVVRTRLQDWFRKKLHNGPVSFFIRR